MSTLAKLLVELGFDGDKFDSGVGKAASQWDSVSKSMLKTGGMLTAAITVPMLAVGKVALDAAINYDNALDTIQTKTGATGDELTKLGDVARRVYRSIPTDMQTAADTVATLNQRTGATDDALQQLTATEIELARITGGDLAAQVDSTTQMFAKWGISINDQVGALDKIYAASQETGASVQSLAANLVKYAQPLSELGFNFDESIAILAQFEEAGVNTDQAMAGLKLGLVNLAKEGITDADTAFRTMVDRIKSAPSDIEATRIAVELFGAKAGPELAKAIRDGRLDVDGLVKAINDGRPGILDTAAATNDFAEKLQIVKNRATDALLPLGQQLFTALNNLMPLFEIGTAKLASLIEKFNALPSSVQTVIGIFAGALFVLGPLLLLLGTLIQVAPAVGAAFTLMTGPVGIAIVAIVAAIAALYWAYNTNFLGFRDGVNAAIDSIVAKFHEWQPQIEATKKFFIDAWNAISPVVTVVAQTVIALLTNMVTTVKGVLEGQLRFIKGNLQLIKGIFTLDWGLIKEGVTNIVGGMKDSVVAILTGLWSNALIWMGLIKKAITGPISNAASAVADYAAQLKQSVIDRVQELYSYLTSMDDWFASAAWDMGVALAQGIVAGLNSLYDWAVGYAGSFAGSVVDAFKDKIIPGSPSKVTTYLGEMMGEGLALGLRNTQSQAIAAAADLAGNAVRAVAAGTTNYDSSRKNYSISITNNITGNQSPEVISDLTFARFARELQLREGS